jgi:ssDNA-binding replication factor A large subunit
MKASLCILMLLFSISLVASQAKQESSNQEVSGTIKDVSINVRRLTIETAEHRDRIVSVEPETRILFNRREGTLEDLKPGQSIRIVLPRDSSKAILIEVNS